MYRGFVKNINNLAGRAISSADMRITSMNIKRDILTKATSDFKVVAVPNAVNEGDVFGVYDDYGKVVYLGIIKSIDDNNIQCDQIIALFDDKWKWRNPSATTIEGKLKDIIDNDYANSSDALEREIYNDFSVTTISATENDFASQDSNYVVNMMQFLFEMYESYSILVDINISFNEITPTIVIGKQSYPVIKLGNNNQVLRNFEITRETQEINKLVIYDKDGNTLRGTYYATPSGITTDSSSLDRLTDINTEIECSDDDINDIIASNISEHMYNHKITCQLVLDNKLYDFDLFHLGQQFDIYYDGLLYNSILTGYKISIDNEGKASVVNLTFGKVRYSLENIIYKLKKETSSNSTDVDVPTKTSELENDTGYITDEALDGYVEDTDLVTINNQSLVGVDNINIQDYEEIKGTNIYGRKWANGFLEYFIDKYVPAGSYTSWQGHYYRDYDVSITFPTAFTNAQGAVAGYSNATCYSTQTRELSNTKAPLVRLMAFTNQSSMTGYVHIYIWGYWK